MSEVVNRSVEEIAKGVANAMQKMSVSELGGLYADDIVIWHNYDGKTQNKSENLAALSGLFTHCRRVAYVNIDRQKTDRGYVQQHNIEVEFINGNTVSVPCCHVVRVGRGCIQRFDEYLDPSSLFHLMAGQ